jgi:hypothetical protein
MAAHARCSRACPADGLCLKLYCLKAPIFRAFRSELVMHVGVLIALLRGVTLPFLASISGVFESQLSR